MVLYFNTNLAEKYHSNSQKIRIMSEDWVCNNVYCVKCGNNLAHFENNKPVGDFYCKYCKEEFELKTNKTRMGKEIPDGAFSTMIGKIEDGTIPNFFHLNYNLSDYSIENLVLIPKHYFTKNIIIKRTPLRETARRAGWIGCNIDVSAIPLNGKIYLIRNKQIIDKKIVIHNFNKMLFLRNQKEELRGWLLDIMKCIELLGQNQFNIDEIYAFETVLRIKYPNNNNIKAKIRQQLQILRDYKYLTFIGRGVYKLL